MSKYTLTHAVLISLALASPALADDWSGKTVPLPAIGSIGPTPASILQSENLVVACAPANTPPPCTSGQTPTYVGSNVFDNSHTALPATTGSGDTFAVSINGNYADPTSPTGLSEIHGAIALSSFATASSVSGLSTSVSALNSTVGSLSISFNALSSTVGTLGTSVSALSTNVNAMSAQLSSLSVQFTHLQQQAQLQDRDLRQGVAMSLAMDGVGDLGRDEHVAISMNFGTFGGQNGMAAGIAFRAADHLTFNGGIGTGVNGGLVGGRVGARLAW